MSALIDGNTEYQAVKIMRVDWGTYKNKPLVSDLGIKRRSTLVMFRNGKEIDRVIAQTSIDDIEPMFVKAISG